MNRGRNETKMNKQTENVETNRRNDVGSGDLLGHWLRFTNINYANRTRKTNHPRRQRDDKQQAKRLLRPILERLLLGAWCFMCRFRRVCHNRNTQTHARISGLTIRDEPICKQCGHQKSSHGDWTGECFECDCQQFTETAAAMPNEKS